MSIDIGNSKTKIGIVKHQTMDTDFVVFALIGNQKFTPVNVPTSDRQVEFIREQKLGGVIITMPTFNERNYKSLLHIAKMIGDIPIVVVAERISKLVKINMGFIGRIGYADYNEGLADIPHVLDQLINRTSVITRQFLRRPSNASTSLAGNGPGIPAKIIDISVGGAKISAPTGTLEKGEVISFGIPRGMNAPLMVDAKIVRLVDEDNASQVSGREIFGVQFTKLTSKKNAA